MCVIWTANPDRVLESRTLVFCQLAQIPTFEALRLLWTVAYLRHRFLRADSQHNAATVEQARVESGYDEEVILLNRTR
jgi:hypothetical protein